MHDGYNADALHGDLSQAQRDTVMQKFRIRNIQLLVATDVAARGLDVSDLTHVINYNLPDDVEIYTHRSGRTGRANKKGIAVSIIHSKERFKIKDIERMLRKNFIQEQIPNGLEVCKKQLFYMIDRMQNVEVNEEQIEPYTNQIMKQLEGLDKEEIIKRFVSIEFNRFLTYYKDAEDLNYHEKSHVRGEFDDRRGDRGARSDRGERSGDRGDRQGKRIRLKINIGDREGLDPKRFLGIINDVTGDKSISIGAIEVTNKFTFFDVFSDQVEKVITSFAGESEYQVSEAKGSKAADGGIRKPEYRPRTGGGDSPRREYDRSSSSNRASSTGSSAGAGAGGYRKPAASTEGGDKPWRSRSTDDRPARRSSSSEGGDRKRSSGGFKKRY
jgi:ATP-dependent RNA helicase DeaD